jgi:hypothetical protein
MTQDNLAKLRPERELVAVRIVCHGPEVASWARDRLLFVFLWVGVFFFFYFLSYNDN